MDEVVDHLEEVAAHIVMFDLREIRFEVGEFARTLFGAGAFGQFGADEYHQQALRLGLGARGAQQVVKVLDLHG